MSVDFSDPTSRRESLISFSSCSTDPLPRDTTLVANLESRTSCCTQQVFSSGAWIKCAVGVIGIGGVVGFVPAISMALLTILMLIYCSLLLLLS